MRFIKYLFWVLILAMPASAHAGTTGFGGDIIGPAFLSSYYDLRDRSSYLQITNLDNSGDSCRIHVQIFQHDRECDELNFFDTLTPNDTVVYNLDNLIRNNGSQVPANLNDNSYGYVVVIGSIEDGCSEIIGNFRILDDAGYEYRTNMAQIDGPGGFDNLYANFNTVDGANQADIVGYSYFISPANIAINNDFGFNVDIFAFDLAEEPLSCDTRNFACGNVMNYGVNEDYPNSRGGPLLCPGGGLADPNGGFVLFDNLTLNFPDGFSMEGDVLEQGFIGINNGNGTGSMDQWIVRGGFGIQ